MPAITAALKNVNLAVPDVTLRLDLEGVIREVSVANIVSDEGVQGWVGRPWVETVGGLGSDRVLGIVAGARAHGVSEFRQVTQRFPSGLELPMEYNAVRLGAAAGLIAIGRNLQAVASVRSSVLAAQQALTQDAWKLRTVETRDRLLFDSSNDPILLLRTRDLNIFEANLAAVRAGAMDSGRDFAAAVASRDRAALRTMVASVHAHGRAQGVLLHLGEGESPWLVRASLASHDAETMLLIQLSPAAHIHPRRDFESLDALIERFPDGFVLVDASGLVQRANRAFMDLVEVAAPGAVIGQPIGRWLSLPGADASVLLARIARHKTMRNFATTIHGELGGDARVEISASADNDAAPRHIGLLVRDVSRRLRGDDIPMQEEQFLGTLSHLTEQIGQTPLLQLVRDAAGLIERHCIEGALERSGGNRTAAAEMLGLSRQSLYAKLARYDMGGAAAGESAAFG